MNQGLGYAGTPIFDLAVGTRDVETREQMIRMAELWARLADRADDRKKELAISDAA